MIQTDKLIFVENPKSGSTWVSDILIEQLGGFRITPRHDPIFEPVDEKVRTVFTIVRNPSQRMTSMIKNFGRGEPPVEEFFEAEYPEFHTKPQAYWTQNCHKVLRFEDMPHCLEELLLETGHTGFDFFDWNPTEYEVEDSMQKFLESKGEDYSLWPKKRGRPPKKTLTTDKS